MGVLGCSTRLLQAEVPGGAHGCHAPPSWEHPWLSFPLSSLCVSFPGHLQQLDVPVLGSLGHFGTSYPPALAGVPVVLLPHSRARRTQGKGSCALLVGSTTGWGKGVHEQLQQGELGMAGLFQGW